VAEEESAERVPRSADGKVFLHQRQMPGTANGREREHRLWRIKRVRSGCRGRQMPRFFDTEGRCRAPQTGSAHVHSCRFVNPSFEKIALFPSRNAVSGCFFMFVSKIKVLYLQRVSEFYVR